MWIFAENIGFISVVQHDERGENLLVRARRRDHLERAFPDRTSQIIDAEKEAVEVSGSYDYAWRVEVPRGEVIELMTEALLDLEYTSHVKEEVSGDDHQLYASMMDCWTAMMRYQQLADSRDEDMWGQDADE